MNNKINLQLERFWLLITFLVFCFCVFEYFADGIEVAKFYLLAMALPLMMWVFRRFLRKKFEKIEERKNEQSAKNNNK